MPVPTPNFGEEQDAFVERCHRALADEFTDSKQRHAVCMASWRDHARAGSSEKFQAKSHRLTRDEGKVTIHDLELFVGFDAALDDPRSKRLARFDADEVRKVVERTREFISRGQTPKLILGHNEPGMEGSDKPTIGDIQNVRFAKVNGTAGIIGDVTLDEEKFDKFLKSNAYPRRSAEIWPDGYMSEVALLGAKTPARPLPDTHFSRSGRVVEVFCRDLPVLTFQLEPAPIMGEPGPVSVPGEPEKPEPTGASQMPMPDDKRNGDDELKKRDEEIARFKKMCAEREDEIGKLKTRLSKFMDEEDSREREKARMLRQVGDEKDTFERKWEAAQVDIAELKRQNVKEKFSRKIDELHHKGYHIPDHVAMLNDVIDAFEKGGDPDKRFEFLKTFMQRGPINVRVDQRHAALPSGARKDQLDKESRAAQAARDKALMEGHPERFAKYYEDAMAAS